MRAYFDTTQKFGVSTRLILMDVFWRTPRNVHAGVNLRFYWLFILCKRLLNPVKLIEIISVNAYGATLLIEKKIQFFNYLKKL
jgi:hypothetical protein